MYKIMKSFIIKAVIIVVLWALIIGFRSVFMPVLTNDVALQQMQISDMGYIGFQSWNVIWGWVRAIMSIISVAIFIPNFVALIKLIKKEDI